ncbi:hypothetical protein D9758_007096 [Tetrapyrgos nigripes]|uniref:HRDC domain-containing protein n=1 Tax=Tetrapyrgos nigripes TaxID=182062 RepID=A0A8H5LMQ4_9AGAR|nr:hypothetical protein D9758_007096 [Tetrapyrgos nigripes]
MLPILGVANKILGLVGASDSNGKGKAKAKLESEEDVVDNFHSLVVDTMDQLLEKTDMNLDEFLGRNKAPAIAINPSTRNNKKSNNASGGQLDPVIQHASHLPKPQASFKKKIDNSDSPWYPTLTHKYHAQIPLGYHFHDEEENRDGGESSAKPIKLHPYLYEITHLNYPSHLFSQSTPIPPTPFSTTSATWVSTPSELHAMISTLVHSNSKPTEIAVDLEHHSYRSYRGFLCLMQISTREQDWIVDLCVPEIREEAEALNEVFADPSIVKVFHGAESDIIWLQQDFNIYVVNLFDTFHASKVLGFPRHGLANLLEMYCDFTPDKRYQLADWRIRPLPNPMLTYARSDTHFLLYIYDNLRNALLDRSRPASPSNTPPHDASSSSSLKPPQTQTRNAGDGSQGEGNLDEVLKRSAETSLRVYEKEVYDAEGGSGSGGWDTLAKKWNRAHLMADWVPPSVHTAESSLPREVFKTVHAWRDKISREEDESTRYILPNHHLFTLAESPPADITALLRIFPGTNVPPVIRRRAAELVAAVRGAVKKCLEGGASVLGGGQQESGEGKGKGKQKDEETGREVRKGPIDGGPMDVDTPTPTPAVNQKSIWTPSSSVTSKSSLFGNVIPSSSFSRPAPDASSTGKNIATSTSALFGNIGRVNVIDTLSKPQQPETQTPTPRRFEEVVARIHSTLVVSASLPVSIGRSEAKISDTIPSTSYTTTTATAISTSIPANNAEGVSEEENGTLSSNVQIELPFIPASQRAASTRSAIATKDDTIVVVGQARQKREKKRKRQRTQGEEESEAQAQAIDRDADADAVDVDEGDREQPKMKKSKKAGKKATSTGASVGNPEEHEVEAFDFSSAPNILDAVPSATHEASARGRRKKDKKNQEKKGSSTFYGDFPAPPKAHSELKSGNIAHTFK